MPVPAPGAQVFVNGRPMTRELTDGGKRAAVRMSGPGTFVVTNR